MIDILGKDQGQLSILYQKWMENPSQYGQEMAITVDKIIHSTLATQRLRPIYWRTEELEDLMQDLRLLCFKNLRNIKNASNKSIFNYLRISIIFYLKDKTRKVGKYLDREEKENEVLGGKVINTTMFCFGDTRLDQIAYLLSHGETKQNICSMLGITRSTLNKDINKLKQSLS